jgi:hypothetical protein
LGINILGSNCISSTGNATGTTCSSREVVDVVAIAPDTGPEIQPEKVAAIDEIVAPMIAYMAGV